MKRTFSLASVVSMGVCLFAVAAVRGQETKTPQMLKLFREVIAKSGESTVRVLVADKPAALGTVVSADGWILSKYSVLKEGKITCRLPDGKELAAEMVGYDVPFDLAMLKVDARDLTPVQWTDSKASRVGHWVASVGMTRDPVALGVISVAAREVKGAKFLTSSGSSNVFLGVVLEFDFAGVKILKVQPDTPADRAGLKDSDQIVAINGTKVENADEFLALLTQNKPGDVLKLKISREEEQLELKAKLGQRPGGKGGKSRSDMMNSMGSKLSDRRAGFPIILQHDSVLKPADCGGPLVNLDGKVLGINISRAGRTESYAIPSEAVLPLLEKLKKGK